MMPTYPNYFTIDDPQGRYHILAPFLQERVTSLGGLLGQGPNSEFRMRMYWQTGRYMKILKMHLASVSHNLDLSCLSKVRRVNT